MRERGRGRTRRRRRWRARSRGLREGIGDAQSRVSFPSPAPSPEGTISSGTENAREPGRGDPRIPSLFQLLPCLICANFVQYVTPLRRLDSPVLSVRRRACGRRLSLSSGVSKIRDFFLEHLGLNVNLNVKLNIKLYSLSDYVNYYTYMLLKKNFFFLT